MRLWKKTFVIMILCLTILLMFFTSCTVIEFKFDVKAEDQVNTNIQDIPFKLHLSYNYYHFWNRFHSLLDKTQAWITKTGLQGIITGINYEELEAAKVEPNFTQDPQTGIQQSITALIPHYESEKTRSFFYRWLIKSYHYDQTSSDWTTTIRFDDFDKKDEDYDVFLKLWTQHKCDINCEEQGVVSETSLLQEYTDNEGCFLPSQPSQGWFNSGASIKFQTTPLIFTDNGGRYKAFSNFSENGKIVSNSNPYTEHTLIRPMSLKANYSEKELKAQVNGIDLVTGNLLTHKFKYDIYYKPEDVTPAAAVQDEKNKLKTHSPCYTTVEYNDIPAGRIILKYDGDKEYYLNPSYISFVAEDNYRYSGVHWGDDTFISDPYYLGNVVEDFVNIPLTIKTEFKLLREFSPSNPEGWPEDIKTSIVVTTENGELTENVWALEGDYSYSTENEYYSYNRYGWKFLEWTINDQKSTQNPKKDYINNPTKITAFFNPYIEIRATTTKIDEKESWIPDLPVKTNIGKSILTSDSDGKNKKDLTYNSALILYPDLLYEDQKFESSHLKMAEKPHKRYLMDGWAGKYHINPTAQIPQTPNELPLLMDRPQWPVMQLKEQALIFCTTNHPSGTESYTVKGVGDFAEESKSRFWNNTGDQYKFKTVYITTDSCSETSTTYKLESIKINGVETKFRTQEDQNECFVPFDPNASFILSEPVHVEFNYSCDGIFTGNEFTEPTKRRFIFNP